MLTLLWRTPQPWGFRVVWRGRETRSYWTFPCQLYERLPEWETHLFFSTFLKGNFSFFRATFSRFLSASNWNDSSDIQKPLTRFLLSHMADIIRKRAAGFSRQTCQKLHIVFLVKKNLHTLYVFWCITIQATGRGKKRWRCNKQSTGRKRKVFK